mmetsp:Transcript_41350/g.117467  ORF Transcript_41350/g.117467 Transcript_41350/m.117467 type:complete len:249 (-) Transcript_41350:277-1023(-)
MKPSFCSTRSILSIPLTASPSPSLSASYTRMNGSLSPAYRASCRALAMSRSLRPIDSWKERRAVPRGSFASPLGMWLAATFHKSHDHRSKAYWSLSSVTRYLCENSLSRFRSSSSISLCSCRRDTPDTRCSSPMAASLSAFTRFSSSVLATTKSRGSVLPIGLLRLMRLYRYICRSSSPDPRPFSPPVHGMPPALADAGSRARPASTEAASSIRRLTTSLDPLPLHLSKDGSTAEARRAEERASCSPG